MTNDSSPLRTAAFCWDALGLGCTATDELLYVESLSPADFKASVRRPERPCDGLTHVAMTRPDARRAFVGMILSLALLFAVLPGSARAAEAAPTSQTRPLLRDFIGLCVHTVQFRPALYRPVCDLVRDYHDLRWDLGDATGQADTAYATRFPFARNGVDWQDLYGGWREAGYRVHVTAMFDAITTGSWRHPAADARAYGEAFARYFGPSAHRLVESVEVGNEPGLYSDAVYRTLFEAMARGLRAGDPALRVATCAATAGPSTRYARSLSCFEGLGDLFDIVTVHTYAQIEGWPTWRRSYPEDAATPYLRDVREALAWRDAHAPGKPVWVTEFGWDASSRPAPATGDFSRWQGSTEAEQARYLAQSLLLFSALDVARAYIYWFNDDDQPQVHGSSGLTRRYEPKPAFYAVAQLRRVIGDYRFRRVVAEGSADAPSVTEYERGDDPSRCVWAVWFPVGGERRTTCRLALPAGAQVLRAERLALLAGDPEAAAGTSDAAGGWAVECRETPTFLFLQVPGETPAR